MIQKAFVDDGNEYSSIKVRPSLAGVALWIERWPSK